MLLRTLSFILATMILIFGRRFPKAFIIILPIGYLMEFFFIVLESLTMPQGDNNELLRDDE